MRREASLNDVMLGLAKFLSCGCEAARETVTTLTQVESSEFMSDWAQANWEILVDTPIQEFGGPGKVVPEAYEGGADCNDASSRVWLPDALPTHRIVCHPRDNAGLHDLLSGNLLDATNVPVVFDQFAVKLEHDWYDQAPPIDCVLGHYDDRQVLVPVD